MRMIDLTHHIFHCEHADTELNETGYLVIMKEVYCKVLQRPTLVIRSTSWPMWV